MAFCVWRTQHLTTLGKLPPGHRIRLPTEAEWEWAARGRTARRYPWGDAKCSKERLNYNGNIGTPTPVGLYPLGATPEGVLDLAGNIWEWCYDLYAEGYYRICQQQGKVKNPIGPASGQNAPRVLRGGSWVGNSDFARADYRSRHDPVDRSSFIGFRLLSSAPIDR
jgi:formylglycine-generating enzyme required for sulfatase activity